MMKQLQKQAVAVAEGDLAMTELGIEDSQAALENAKQNCMEVDLQTEVKELQPVLAELIRLQAEMDQIRQGSNADLSVPLVYLVTRLEEEAIVDETEKAYCDEKMAKTEEKKAELEHDYMAGLIQSLGALVDAAAFPAADK